MASFCVIYSGLRYSALGFLYVRIPGISSFQWHPFSTTSSSMQKTNEMSICIKPLGAWTKDVQKLIESANSSTKLQDPKSAAACPFQFQLFAEGPYGHQKDYFLRYISFPDHSASHIRDVLYRMDMRTFGVSDMLYSKRSSFSEAFHES